MQPNTATAQATQVASVRPSPCTRTAQQVTTGAATSVASYDRSQQRFANVRAARDAEIRAATVLADQIRTRLGIALLDHK